MLHIHIRQKLVKYALVFLFFVWLIAFGYLYYQYVISSSEQIPAKGGTLVEGVTTNISYLPYVRDTDADLFYQGLLYRACMNYFGSGYQIIYEPDVCKVLTQDNKTFVVSLNTTGSRSDGTPVSIEDVLFTYQDIIKENFRDIPNLRNFQKVDIEKLSEDSLRVTFPGASVDNFNFFTNYILPKHKLKGAGLNYYLTEFKAEPVTSNCASIKAGQADESSLVFDVENCDKAWIRYYQVKKIENPKDLATAKLVDITVTPNEIEGYKNNKLILNKYIGVFFNMQRGRLSIYGRKNIIALLNFHLFNSGNTNAGLIKENFLFDAFPTRITDKVAIIASVLPVSITGAINTSGIVPPSALPDELNIDNIGEKRDFTLPEVTKDFTLTIKSPKPYDTLGITANDQLQEQAETTTNKVVLTLVPGFNLFDGINTYTIQGMGKDRDETVASINIYYKAPYKVSREGAIKVIYYSGDPQLVGLIHKIRTFLGWEDLASYFDFQGFSTAEEFEGKLASKEYDITIRGIDLGLKKDISNLLLTDNPIINPSLYINTNLASQINQFFATSNPGSQWSIKREIDRLYLNDLPFVLLGKNYSLLHTKPYVFLEPNQVFYEHDYRKKILHNVVMASRPIIHKSTLLNFRGFFQFLLQTLAR